MDFEGWKTHLAGLYVMTTRNDSLLVFYLFLPLPYAFYHFFWISRRPRSTLTNAIYIFSKKTRSEWGSIVTQQNDDYCRFLTLINQGAKVIPVQSKYFPTRFLQEPNTLLVPGIRVISSSESRKCYKHKQHTQPAKLRHHVSGTLQQFVPAGTAVLNQQD